MEVHYFDNAATTAVREEVLKEIGYTDEQIKTMEEKKAAVQIDTTQFKHLDEEM